jgi:pimeloyl-ACP methyl ester carboxylesterase
MFDATTSLTVNAPTCYVESRGRRLAYRSIGMGQDILLCVRFRGTMDVWDPAFIDALAGFGFRVTIFDYSGLGFSTGIADYNPISLAGDARDLMEALDLTKVVMGGWSLGGLAAQAAFALYPERIARLLLIGSGPPGTYIKLPQQLFYDVALHPINTPEDQLILFFEPASESSRAAGMASMARIAARTQDLSPVVPIDFAETFLGREPKTAPFPADAVLDILKATDKPILHLGGDNDISFPIENWYALSGQLPTLQLMTYPSTGHAPHHQHPMAAAAHIATFARFS